MFWREEKAQGSIELLVLVAGAVIVVAIVGVLLKNAATTAADEAACKARSSCEACIADTQCRALDVTGAEIPNAAACETQVYETCAAT
jgi:uncharacterized protein (UPF0333 family)